ncbi:CRISPR-associated helicase Cas3' [Rhodoferax antarcticus]|uniref:CRISPR-associated helicase Cas3' n=1 Tax=Rhodoferax antarcticus TaxID=81479 RepID=UPI002224011B|nr:CRISPR-associated helicase Cas3' [Rhodoferax antarcticus]MCW2311082.1 CRISPR-associated endonuclease/helicase Cas3 [Rhodoferax antarcticus]
MSIHFAHVRKADGAIQLLPDHLTGVARLSGEFARKIGLPQQGELIGLLHDFGKYSAEFQHYLKSAVELLNPDEDEFVDAKGLKGKVDHSTAGAQLVWQELAKFGQLGQIVAQILALCIASHHSGLIDCLSSDENSLGDDAFNKRLNKADERSHLNEALAVADDLILMRSHALMADPSMISAIQSLIGKIIREAPEKNDRSIVAQQHIGLLVRFLFSCLIDADRMDTADFENPRQAKQRMVGRYADWDTLCFRLEAHLADFTPRYPIDQLRQDISQHCLNAAKRSRGIFSLTVPTGGGKTLASLRFALQHAKVHQMERVIYVIPFTSIIDQNADVVRRILEPQGVVHGTVVLEHHSNLTPESQTWRGKILSENWDAPIVYTTSVQFLETLFGSGTRGARRMHQLANAVLIFDEIQTLPVNCVHLFNNAINFLVEQCGSTVVLCTATQPLLNKVDVNKGAIRIPDGNELMPNVKKLFDDLKRVEVRNRRKPGGWTMEEIALLAQEETLRANSCLVIVNTKNSAQTIYRLGKQHATIPVYHLSTNMCPAHRKSVLAEVRIRLEKQEQTLLVSTQLIEAGVDVDFGAVIRFMAGLDSIAQASGRCNRNGRSAVGLVHVVNPQGENLSMLPDISIGRDMAERVLSDYEANPAKFGNNLIGVQTLDWYYQNYFFARAGEMVYPVSEKVIGHSDSLLNLLTLNTKATTEHCRIKGQAPNIYLRQSFMAAAKAFKAIDAPTRGVIVPYGQAGKDLIADLCGAYMPDKEFDLLRRAQQFSVNVFPNVLETLQKYGVVQDIRQDTGILFLTDSRYYSNEFGLSTTPEGNMEVLYG